MTFHTTGIVTLQGYTLINSNGSISTSTSISIGTSCNNWSITIHDIFKNCAGTRYMEFRVVNVKNIIIITDNVVTI